MNIQVMRHEPDAQVVAAADGDEDMPIRLSLGRNTTVYLSTDEAAGVVDELIAALAAAPS